MPDAEVPPTHEAQGLSDRDQTDSDADQSAADLDQTVAESEQRAADRDQVAADRDQEASDRDQSASDAAQGPGPGSEDYLRSRRSRARSTIDRDISSHVRTEATRMRLGNAVRRDRVAADRDAAARARDQLATTLDAEFERLESELASGSGNRRAIELSLLAASDRKRAAQTRDRAAAQRDAAAQDREQAARDREQAAHELQAAYDELSMEGVDVVTGTLRRRVGLAAIQRELDRTARSGEPLVVALLDVGELDTVSETEGHDAGDRLLRDVAGAVREVIRSYDVLARFDRRQFVCSLAGQSEHGARTRFEEVVTRLGAQGAGLVALRLAERRPDDAVSDLIARAREAPVAARSSARPHVRT